MRARARTYRVDISVLIVCTDVYERGNDAVNVAGYVAPNQLDEQRHGVEGYAADVLAPVIRIR